MSTRSRTAAATSVRLRGRRRVPREQPLVVTVEHATEDDPAVADAAVRFLRRLMELGAKE